MTGASESHPGEHARLDDDGERVCTTAVARPEAVGELRREMAQYAEQAGASQVACEAVALAVSEAVTNVVMHAYVGRAPGVVVAEAWTDSNGHLLLTVCDEGWGMVPRADSPGLGLGIPLMAQMADDLHVANRGDLPGTMVSLRFTLDGSGANIRAGGVTA
jgi:serine/threonine-protein kinase RsbW/stage II sporulation protein AB (anti-sigma F factor)